MHSFVPLHVLQYLLNIYYEPGILLDVERVQQGTKQVRLSQSLAYSRNLKHASIFSLCEINGSNVTSLMRFCERLCKLIYIHSICYNNRHTVSTQLMSVILVILKWRFLSLAQTQPKSTQVMTQWDFQYIEMGRG